MVNTTKQNKKTAKKTGNFSKQTCLPAGKSWKQYNESLINRGTCLIDISFLKKQEEELAQMNKNKMGAPYKCTNSQIEFLAGLYVGFDIPYRSVQGVCRGLSEIVRIPELHFTQIRRRILKLETEINNLNLDDTVELVFDSSGLSTTNRGTYLEDKWKRQKREYVKLHVSVDVKTKKIVSYKITHGHSSDTKQFIPLFKEAKKHCKKIRKSYADKAYDDQNNFDYCDKNKTIPAIRIKNNAVPHRTKSRLRRKEILYINKYGFERWKKNKDAGKRWIVEIVYSALKRVLGERLRSKNFDALCVEAGLKVLLYNKFLDTG